MGDMIAILVGFIAGLVGFSPIALRLHKVVLLKQKTSTGKVLMSVTASFVALTVFIVLARLLYVSCLVNFSIGIFIGYFSEMILVVILTSRTFRSTNK